ncbi:inactive leucine-rich repeat receptor-like serine/threonine-protein kinase, partial [Tanacetum coccineum]
MISSANRRASAEAPISRPCAALGALLDSSEALSFSEARGSILFRLQCVLADSLAVALSGLYANEHSEVLCVRHRRLGSGREMGYTYVGKVPPLNQSGLKYLNLSNNQLSGEIPATPVLEKFNVTSFSGNVALCGEGITIPCGGLSPS